MTLRGGISESIDFDTQRAIAEVRSSYRVELDPFKNAKSLNKIGQSGTLAQDTLTTVAQLGAGEVHETLVTTNVINRLVSSSTSDVGKVVIQEGHTIDSNGNKTFVVQTVTLNGQTPVALTTPLARSTRLLAANGTFASPATDLVGTVYSYEGTSSVTSGVPQTAASVHCTIQAGNNKSRKGATTLSSTDFWFITRIECSALKSTGSAGQVDVTLQARELGGVWQHAAASLTLRTDSAPFDGATYSPLLIIPANADVRLVALSDTANVVVSGTVHGFLARAI